MTRLLSTNTGRSSMLLSRVGTEPALCTIIINIGEAVLYRSGTPLVSQRSVYNGVKAPSVVVSTCAFLRYLACKGSHKNWELYLGAT